MLALASIALLTGMLIYIHRPLHLSDTAWAAMQCLIGGGIGNLLDRVIFSGVTDYIRLRFMDFPVFNLADVAITGAIMVLIALLFTDTLEEHVEDKHGSGA